MNSNKNELTVKVEKGSITTSYTGGLLVSIGIDLKTIIEFIREIRREWKAHGKRDY